MSSLILPPRKAATWPSKVGSLLLSPSGTPPVAISGTLELSDDEDRSRRGSVVRLNVSEGADAWGSLCRFYHFQKRLATLA